MTIDFSISKQLKKALETNKFSPGEFEQMEQELFLACKQAINCKNCGVSHGGNKANKAGDANKAGVQRLSVTCKSCKKSNRFHETLKKSKATVWIGDKLNDAVQRVVNNVTVTDEDRKALEEIEKEISGLVISSETGKGNAAFDGSVSKNIDWAEEADWDSVNQVSPEMRFTKLEKQMAEIMYKFEALKKEKEEMRCKVEALEKENEELKKQVERYNDTLGGNPGSKQEKEILIIDKENEYIGNNNDKKEGEKGITYAGVAKERMSGLSENQVLKWIKQSVRRVDTTPNKIVKSYMKINVSVRHKLLARKELYGGIYVLLQAIGIRQEVKEVSLIGRSLVELYHKEGDTEKVREVLKEKEILVEKFDPMESSKYTNKNFEAVNQCALARIVTLLKRNHGKMFREAILEDHNEQFKQEALKKVEGHRYQLKIGDLLKPEGHSEQIDQEALQKAEGQNEQID